ncbi:hypothetical protein RRX38_21815 [Pseudomonas sp. DTU_2021_1001937_2_SI_NGA_ILE_001]|uniref:hypothetical protein n=1 Tax=Pseudomonas sp. DTU_2021_1001937_2_SI_NGA_ILE_001 TaxID=3077589 RepID=UPI0028FC150B|nr:hypothetical protein [Pseudomonas sp. DTU_2021_1001937_2_SI_NGA_ILE_001]WNW13684.1 hypothetical protein RRX38_21815 [Pseudomonas sp. DTU_2021_1001937_2_SI_NGA_ILE_001]
MSQRIQSPSLQDPNLKSLASLDGLDDVPLARLCIYKTPALDVLALLDKPLPELQAVRLASGKRALDQQIEARREALGIALSSGAFE